MELQAAYRVNSINPIMTVDGRHYLVDDGSEMRIRNFFADDAAVNVALPDRNILGAYAASQLAKSISAAGAVTNGRVVGFENLPSGGNDAIPYASFDFSTYRAPIYVLNGYAYVLHVTDIPNGVISCWKINIGDGSFEEIAVDSPGDFVVLNDGVYTGNSATGNITYFFIYKNDSLLVATVSKWVGPDNTLAVFGYKWRYVETLLEGDETPFVLTGAPSNTYSFDPGGYPMDDSGRVNQAVQNGYCFTWMGQLVGGVTTYYPCMGYYDGLYKMNSSFLPPGNTYTPDQFEYETYILDRTDFYLFGADYKFDNLDYYPGFYGGKIKEYQLGLGGDFDPEYFLGFLALSKEGFESENVNVKSSYTYSGGSFEVPANYTDIDMKLILTNHGFGATILLGADMYLLSEGQPEPPAALPKGPATFKVFNYNKFI